MPSFLDRFLSWLSRAESSSGSPTASGIAGPVGYNIPMKWTTVRELQEHLKALGKYAGMIDGDFGPATLAAFDSIQDNAAPWMDVARAEYGVSELYGSRHNPRILEYHATTSLRASADEVAWCSSFVCWCLERVKIASTRLANARSFYQWGKHTFFRYGAICVFKRGSNPASGHVAFLVCLIEGRAFCLGGNQGNRVKVSSFPLIDLLDTRWPV